ncbi:unnamed protein product [Nippostrongylus brasiliensis]|uniref:Uncharacterized protein n=1 Tax=Nippostrongylus brasiliensis TaxID=27835 RepID=A0A0N4XCJ3_NIPBR|nr:unnamed protein product [Nippostrongylus brasiliensis]
MQYNLSLQLCYAKSIPDSSFTDTVCTALLLGVHGAAAKSRRISLRISSHAARGPGESQNPLVYSGGFVIVSILPTSAEYNREAEHHKRRVHRLKKIRFSGSAVYDVVTEFNAAEESERDSLNRRKENPFAGTHSKSGN